MAETVFCDITGENEGSDSGLKRGKGGETLMGGG